MRKETWSWTSARLAALPSGQSARGTFGAFSAVALLCRHPDVFRGAIALSGTFDVSKHLHETLTPEVEAVSPLHYLPHLSEGAQLTALRRRFVQIATGEGDFEQPAQSRQIAETLTARGVPNHLDIWGRRYAHSWATWREMLLKYTAASVGSA
jgi:esterase/lipase superfamily enzyme